MEPKMNRIVLKGGKYTDAEELSRLLSDAGIRPDPEDPGDLAVLINFLAQTVADDDAGHVDLFVMNKGEESYLCANLYAIYLTFNKVGDMLAAFRAVIDTCDFLSCRAVDRDLFVVQFRFLV